MKNNYLFLGVLLVGIVSNSNFLRGNPTDSKAPLDSETLVSTMNEVEKIISDSNQKSPYGSLDLRTKLETMVKEHFSFSLDKKKLTLEDFEKTLDDKQKEYKAAFSNLKSKKDDEKRKKIYDIMGSILKIYTLNVKTKVNSKNQFRFINTHMAGLLYFIKKLENSKNEEEKQILQDLVNAFFHQLYDRSGVVYATDIPVSKGAILKKWFNDLDGAQQKALVYYVTYGFHYGPYKDILQEEVGETFKNLPSLVKSDSQDKKIEPWRNKAISLVKNAEKFTGVDVGEISAKGAAKVNIDHLSVHDAQKDLTKKTTGIKKSLKKNILKGAKKAFVKKFIPQSLKEEKDNGEKK